MNASPAPRPAPAAILEDGQVKKRIPRCRPGPAERKEIILLWDAMSDDARQIAYFALQAVGANDGLFDENGELLSGSR
jgi:hypothetical protein